MNGKLVCESIPGYGETEGFVSHEERDGHHHDHGTGEHILHVSSISQCSAHIGKIVPGDRFTITSSYEMKQHPGMKDPDGSLEPIMGIQFLHLARPHRLKVSRTFSLHHRDLQAFLDQLERLTGKKTPNRQGPLGLWLRLIKREFKPISLGSVEPHSARRHHSTTTTSSRRDFLPLVYEVATMYSSTSSLLLARRLLLAAIFVVHTIAQTQPCEDTCKPQIAAATKCTTLACGCYAYDDPSVVSCLQSECGRGFQSVRDNEILYCSYVGVTLTKNPPGSADTTTDPTSSSSGGSQTQPTQGGAAPVPSTKSGNSGGSSSGTGSGSSAGGSSSGSDGSSDNNGGLKTADIIGIVIGSVSAVAGIVGAWVAVRQRRRRGRRPDSPAADYKPPAYGNQGTVHNGPVYYVNGPPVPYQPPPAYHQPQPIWGWRR
ncbi:hypothetical protein QBC47DRAFT_445166 [Echria macrotheca]|uniref:Extracellular membrane protein CFEM domain-containing protein n=1 Tax=Echria macrotheca TaxID=438768 RepID=A0AAJ0BE19_9PEZI|nr:hypothetical protein QBC47DRAFT_445166 [Echria macrotheca]